MAVIRFYEELNDFLKVEKRKKDYFVISAPGQSVKDLIEGENVPHTEVDLILVNGESVDFSFPVRENDRISVYPVFESFNIKNITRLRPLPLRISRFILDVNLGKLARYLRFSGFDSLYRNNYEDSEIARISSEEERIVLTRDRGLLKRSIISRGYWIRSQSPAVQYREVMRRFDLSYSQEHWSRCTRCNGELIIAEKSKIIEKIPEKTSQHYSAFKICTSCGKIYWKGIHYENFLNMVNPSNN